MFPFTVRRDGTLLGHEKCAILYRLVNEDASHLLPATASARQHAVAAQPCHIGQPVALRCPGGGAALRVSAGARVISETWSGDDETSIVNLQREYHQVGAIFEKIELLVEHI